jgi:hypothetical protein
VMTIRYTEIRVGDGTESFELEIPEGITPISLDQR